MWNFIKSVFTKEFWVAPFPEQYDDECFMCNKTTCKGCEFNTN